MAKQHPNTTSLDKLLKNIDRLLEARGWDIAEYAKRCKPLTSRSVYHYMNKERVPKLDSLDALARPFGLTGAQLIGDLDEVTLDQVSQDIDQEYKKLLAGMTDQQKNAFKQYGEYLLSRSDGKPPY